MNRRTALYAGATAAIAAAIDLALPHHASAADAIRVASVPSDGGLELSYGMTEGIADRHGLAPQVSIMGNGAAMIAAVLGGDLEFANVNIISLLQGHERGVPIALVAPGIVYATTAPQEVLMVAATSPLRTARDLQGKTIAVDGLRNSTQLGTMAWMEQNGADVTTVKWAELPFPQMAAALTAGRVDAALMTEPYLTQAHGDVRVFAKAFDAIAPQFCLTTWVAARPWLAAHADEARRFVATIYATAQWANRHPVDTARTLVQTLHLDPAVVAAMPRAMFAERYDPRLIQPVIDVAVKYGIVQRAVTPAELLAPEVASAG